MPKRRVVATVLSVAALAGGLFVSELTPFVQTHFGSVASATAGPADAAPVAAAPSCCTVEQARYLDTLAWQQAESAAFLRSVADVRAAVPPRLRRIMWCEAGRYKNLPAYQTNYAAMTHGYDGASGGGQAVGSTWRTWAREIGVDVARWPVAFVAPDWVQDAVLTHGYATRGTAPWNPSASCWR